MPSPDHRSNPVLPAIPAQPCRNGPAGQPRNPPRTPRRPSPARRLEPSTGQAVASRPRLSSVSILLPDRPKQPEPPECSRIAPVGHRGKTPPTPAVPAYPGVSWRILAHPGVSWRILERLRSSHRQTGTGSTRDGHFPLPVVQGMNVGPTPTSLHTWPCLSRHACTAGGGGAHTSSSQSNSVGV